MLPLRGDKGRGAARDSPGPEEVRDPPSSLEGKSLHCLSLVVVRVGCVKSSGSLKSALYPFVVYHFGLSI